MDRYLRAHPQIDMPTRKEIDFFIDSAVEPGGLNGPGSWHLGVDWYRRQFPGDKPICGEASPNYSLGPNVAQVVPRIATVLSAARLVYLVRNPLSASGRTTGWRSENQEQPRALSLTSSRTPTPCRRPPMGRFCRLFSGDSPEIESSSSNRLISITAAGSRSPPCSVSSVSTTDSGVPGSIAGCLSARVARTSLPWDPGCETRRRWPSSGAGCRIRPSTTSRECCSPRCGFPIPHSLSLQRRPPPSWHR